MASFSVSMLNSGGALWIYPSQVVAATCHNHTMVMPWTLKAWTGLWTSSLACNCFKCISFFTGSLYIRIFFTPSKTNMEPTNWLFVDFCLGSMLVFRSVKRTNIVVTFWCRKLLRQGRYAFSFRAVLEETCQGMGMGFPAAIPWKVTFATNPQTETWFMGILLGGIAYYIYITLVFQIPCEDRCLDPLAHLLRRPDKGGPNTSSLRIWRILEDQGNMMYKL